MNYNKLFDYLKIQKKDTLIDLLKKCYESMNSQSIRNVFGHLEVEFISFFPSTGGDILLMVKAFLEDSLAGKYYAPFDIDSKNCSTIPEETDMWFEKLGELLTESMRLTHRQEHALAVQCFGVLYSIIDRMENDGTIIFADEYGMWMLSINEEDCIKAYITSASKILEPNDYVNIVFPLIQRDSSSCMNKTYQKAKKISTQQQIELLNNKITSKNE